MRLRNVAVYKTRELICHASGKNAAAMKAGKIERHELCESKLKPLNQIVAVASANIPISQLRTAYAIISDPTDQAKKAPYHFPLT